MLIHKTCPKFLWAEAASTAVYILNWVPTKSLEDITAYEALYGQKPVISNLRNFGSIAFAHKVVEKKDKLDESSIKCIFLGYSSESKGYRFFELINKKLLISRDVIFHEKKDGSGVQKTTTLIKTRLLFNCQLSRSIARAPSKTINSILKTTLKMLHNHHHRLSQCFHQHPSMTMKTHTRTQSSPLKTKLEDINQNLNAVIITPSNFTEAYKEKEWRKPMQEEIDVIEKNETSSLVPRHPQQNIIGLKWVYRVKQNEKGDTWKLKARLVARGFSQKPEEDFDETFAPLAKMTTIRFIIGFAAQHHYPLFQLDVKSAFLNGKLFEDSSSHNLLDLK